MKVLSGGERSRLAMIRLLLEPVNLLILDEPTNHLDMQSKDVLKDAIKDFDGTVIVVSHDREFLDGLVDKVYEFGNQQVKEHLCGIYEFLQKKKMQNLQELEAVVSAKSNQAAKPEDVTTVSENKLSYEDRKELNRLIKRLERQIDDIEKKIEKFEQQKSEIETAMFTPQGAGDSLLFERHGKLVKDTETEMSAWELLAMELEELKLKNT